MFLVSEVEKSLDDKIHSSGAGSQSLLEFDKYKSSCKSISDKFSNVVNNLVGDVEGPGSQKTVDNTEGDTCKVVVKLVEDG